jgi:hypothetical protein
MPIRVKYMKDLKPGNFIVYVVSGALVYYKILLQVSKPKKSNLSSALFYDTTWLESDGTISKMQNHEEMIYHLLENK